MLNFLQSSYKDNRSSKRTDVLHDEIIKALCDTNPKMREYEWKTEVSIDDGYLLPKENKRKKKFKIDIVGVKDGKVRICILAKAMNSSINQNLQNYTNCTLGEASRIMYSPIASDIEKVLFVSFFPNHSPCFNKDGKVKHFENVYMNKPQIGHIVEDMFCGKVKVLDFSYDIANIDEKTCHDDFLDIDIENLNMEQFASV